MSGDAVKSLALSADGKSIVLNVGTPDVCVWTGTAGDGLFSNPVNWAGGVKPTAGGATKGILFAAGSGEAVNDIGALSPAWIAFGGDIGDGFTVSGGGFSGVGAVTNLSSTVNPVIDAPVRFAGDISVKQNATAYENRTGSHVCFNAAITFSTTPKQALSSPLPKGATTATA